jgi:membrane protein
METIRRVRREMTEHNLTLIAAGVAFYAMLALFPALIAMVTIYALVADADQVRGQVEPLLSGLPPNAHSIIVEQLEKAVGANDGGLSLGLVISLLATVWAAAGGVQALMTGLNVVTGQRETRNFLRVKATALGLTVGALVAAAVTLGLVAAFPVLLDQLGLDPVAAIAAQAARWVCLIVMVDVGLAVMYRFGPAPHQARWRWATWGTVTAIAVWVVASAGFSLYVSSFGSYDKTYGTLAAVIVLLLWLWLSALAILLGVEIDLVRDGFSREKAGTPSDVPQKGDQDVSTVVESVDVAVPVHTAYNQWTQFETFPEFMDGVTEIRQINSDLTHWTVEMSGVKREFDARITEQHPDERVAWTSLDGPKHSGVVTFHRLDETHTRVTAQMEIEPEGVAETVGDKTGLIDRKVKGDMKRFKEFIESREVPTGAWRGDIDRPRP